LDVQPLAGTGAQNGVSGADMDSISDQMAKVRAAASSLLGKAENAASVTDLAAAVEKAAAVLKLAAEMDRGRSELAKLTEETSRLKYENETALKREKSERIRDYVALLTPLVTIITLAATLIAQNWQFLRSEKDKREEAQDAQWQDAVKAISASGALSPAVVTLEPFLRSTKYGDRAKDVAVSLLSNSSDQVFFNSLFGPALTPVSWTNIDRLLQLNRALAARGAPVWAKAFDYGKQDDDFKRLTTAELATFNYIDSAATVITSEIGGVLKTQRPSGAPTNFSATFLRNADWSGLNLSGLSLENANLSNLDLQNAELEGVTKFAGVNAAYTAWWEARSINRPLLEHLEGNSKFVPGRAYGPRNEMVKQADYDEAIQRLTAQSK